MGLVEMPPATFPLLDFGLLATKDLICLLGFVAALALLVSREWRKRFLRAGLAMMVVSWILGALFSGLRNRPTALAGNPVLSRLDLVLTLALAVVVWVVFVLELRARGKGKAR